MAHLVGKTVDVVVADVKATESSQLPNLPGNLEGGGRGRDGGKVGGKEGEKEGGREGGREEWKDTINPCTCMCTYMQLQASHMNNLLQLGREHRMMSHVGDQSNRGV